MIDPIFWLGLSILLVAVSLTALLVVAIPAFQELGRAARSAEKLFDTLQRELPPTLEAIRSTGSEITGLTDDMSQGVQSAGQVVKQVDQSISVAKQQAQKAQATTRSVFAGVKAAWRTLTTPARSRRSERLNASSRNSLPYGDSRRSASAEISARSSAEQWYLEEPTQNGNEAEDEFEYNSTELGSESELRHSSEDSAQILPIASDRAMEETDSLEVRESNRSLGSSRNEPRPPVRRESD